MNRYCYWLLNKNEQKIYTQIDDGITNLSSFIRTDFTSKDNLSSIIRSVLTDHPQYFWFEGRVSAAKEKGCIVVMPQYLYDYTEIKTVKRQIEKVFLEIDCCQAANDYDKAKAAYDWLAENVCYSIDNGGQNINNAFIERKAVCKGLSKAYQYLLLKLGVFSTLVDGTIDGVSRHIWNVVGIDGDYYNVDISMGYSIFDYLFDGQQRFDKYRMFLKSDAEMKHTHKWYDSGCCPRLICNRIYKKDVL